MMILLNGKLGFPGGADGKETAYNAGGPGSIPGSPSQLEILRYFLMSHNEQQQS